MRDMNDNKIRILPNVLETINNYTEDYERRASGFFR